ncbi:UDP-N-acetylmuramate--L-alanine ligase [Haloflavibacter putidus]|uniref:UDP-N-acetylmuramate--L-alanine ligase n=1 Tax=Haloflavibacter putidus TaxID=2576776 RepID=A0A508A205_9FLAO|nr:UDP-N-acetylmuramate--L-alanine ligase [Haloflavibacter putidus]TQD39852.1 UDP-N-acetylmuramate--L-alanine ligase [Haloflavibacter putidus]
MNSISNIHNFYFIGIGGIGMSALARYCKRNGKNVGGYDATASQITQQLQEEGISINFSDDKNQLPKKFTDAKDTMVVYTPAVSRENQLYQFFTQNNFVVKKRAEVLGMVTKGFHTIAVAGTHGKTTTTAILAHILKQCGVKLTAFLGGISENYKTNFIADGNQAIVVEADEFDRSFLQLSPNVIGITSVDADHLDIYKTKEELLKTFRDFVGKVDSNKALFQVKSLPFNGKTIAVEETADFKINNLRIEEGSYLFDFKTPDISIKDCKFSLPGKHNLKNAAMAMALALNEGQNPEKIKDALATFKGVDRRFTYHLKSPTVLIEDYAHHPKEIDAVWQAIQEMHPQKKVTAVFQPHLYSRTKDFLKEFAQSLAVFDQIILLPIYPAREKPIAGINAKALLQQIDNSAKSIVEMADLTKVLKSTNTDVIVLLGAGNIGEKAEEIKSALKHES